MKVKKFTQSAVWNRMGLEEPYWSIISRDEFKMENFEQNRKEFFQFGEKNAEFIKGVLQEHGLLRGDDTHDDLIGDSLDFGCGVGRVTMPIALFSNKVDALDISDSLLKIAKKNCKKLKSISFINTHLNQEYLENQIGRYDLVWSEAVLVHNPKEVQEKLLTDLCNAISDVGVGIINIYVKLAEEELMSKDDPGIRMHPLRISEAGNIIGSTGKQFDWKDCSDPNGKDRCGYLIIKKEMV
jgi:SAM-dependent methyltransferase